jgi:hypothetical protein
MVAYGMLETNHHSFQPEDHQDKTPKQTAASSWTSVGCLALLCTSKHHSLSQEWMWLSRAQYRGPHSKGTANLRILGVRLRYVVGTAKSGSNYDLCAMLTHMHHPHAPAGGLAAAKR